MDINNINRKCKNCIKRCKQVSNCEILSCAMFEPVKKKKNKMAGKERELIENERVRLFFFDTRNKIRRLKQAINRL